MAITLHLTGDLAHGEQIQEFITLHISQEKPHILRSFIEELIKQRPQLEETLLNHTNYVRLLRIPLDLDSEVDREEQILAVVRQN